MTSSPTTLTRTHAPSTALRRLAWRWPLPALLAWGAAWTLYAALTPRIGDAAALVVATLLAGALGWLSARPWRRAIVGAGFPAAMALAGGAALPAWLWLVPLGVLVLAYPARTWGDAPLFPTPDGALDALPDEVPLPAGARVRDVGCGLGHGLLALHHAYPQAHVEGIEWSWPLCWWSRLRCRFAEVHQGDLWTDRWDGLDMVYAFQRPETMERLLSKAEAEMRPGSWFVSLAFEAPGRPAHAVLHAPGARPVWVYRIG